MQTVIRDNFQFFQFVVATCLFAFSLVCPLHAANQTNSESAAIRFLNKPVKVLNFELRDHTRRLFDRDQFIGHWTFLYFGYLNCPDICPLTMNVMQQVWKKYPQIHTSPNNAQLVFVSVDPDRDTTDKLAAYLNYFNPDFIGVTGSDDSLEDFSRNIGSIYAYEDDPRNEDSYIVQHTTDLFLINPQGYVVARFPEPHSVTSIYQAFMKAQKHNR